MPHDLDLVPLAAEFAVAGQEQAEELNLAALSHSGATRFVTAARVMTMRATIIAAGTISVFEALLQRSLAWESPFTQLDEHLRAHAHCELAERFLDYRAAINVLKHGAGRSHDRLLSRKGELDFRVRDHGQPFHDEGDVSEVDTLVRADAAFVRQCADIVEEVTSVLRASLPSHSF